MPSLLSPPTWRHRAILLQDPCSGEGILLVPFARADFSDLPIPVLSVKSHTELLLSSAALFQERIGSTKTPRSARLPEARRCVLTRKKFRPGGAVAAPVPLPGKKIP